jgi:hypothetical protein
VSGDMIFDDGDKSFPEINPGEFRLEQPGIDKVSQGRKQAAQPIHLPG